MTAAATKTKPKILERTVKERIKAELRRLDCWYHMPTMTGYGRAGIPDFVGVCKGRMFSIEAKGTGGRLSEAQRHEMRAIADAGGVALVVGPDDIGDIEPALNGHIHYARVH